MRLAPRLAPLRRLSLSLGGCLLLSLLDAGDATLDPPEQGATTASSATSTEPSPSPARQQQDADTVTCYTCVNVSDNLICNRFAIDRPCPVGEPFCHTLHIMDSRGRSVVVHKKCADHTECSPTTVGCLDIDSQRVCVSCCDEMYCNESVPANHTTAVFSSTRVLHTTPAPASPSLSAAASDLAGRIAHLIAVLLFAMRL